MSCAICCEKFNKTNRKEVSCGFCSLSGCRTCHKTYILSSLNEPSCMGCKTPWTVDKLWGEFPRTFLEKEIRQHKEHILLDREKARLPETQNEIFEEKQYALYSALATAYHAMLPCGNRTEVATIRGMITDVRARLGINDAEPVARIAAAKNKKNTNFQAVCPCPSAECRGFIQKRSYTCGICNLMVCSKCRVEREDGHECKADDVATVEALLKDTKPCPSCGTPIFKIDGCDQIWTPCCKKAFSWRTGEFETRIHSPEYYDYCRRMGITIPRAQEQGDADGACNHRDVRSLAAFMRAFDAHQINPQQVERVIKMYRGVLHNQLAGQDMYKDMRPPRDEDGFHSALRRQYILQDITEEVWRKRLIAEERKRERRTALSNIYSVLMQASVDLLNEIVVNCSSTLIDTNLAALENLRSYINECLLGVSRRYKTVPYMVYDNYHIARVRQPQKIDLAS